jgi:putative acetyltransferase
MIIRRATPADREALPEIWLRSVRATHHFLTEEDIQSLLSPARDYLASAHAEFWVLCSESGAVMGFMGMSGSELESLFLAPEFLRCGGGRRLVEHARSLRGELTVSVNEQNTAACRFYEACGFVVEGRSELDTSGRPFPLLHMRLAALSESQGDGAAA